MKNKLISIAVASALVISSGEILADGYDEDSTTKQNNYTAMGIGAVSGALMAGPAGLIVGGFVGSLFGRADSEVEPVGTQLATESNSVAVEELTRTPQLNETEVMMVASSNNVIAQDDNKPSQEINKIKEIVANNLNLAVYFRPGSVNYENFYSQQFSTIAKLLSEMPEMELNLEAYSDRQGNQQDNLQLSAERLQSVRDYFINSGIDASRINIHAYGEKNFLSTPGELDSYVFDRRVVVSFKLPEKGLQNSVAEAAGASAF